MASMIYLASLLFALVSSELTPLWQMELTSNQLGELNAEQAFDQWMEFFNKKYQSVDDQAQHYTTWLENLQAIAAHNSLLGSSYKLRMNQFGDLTPDEFKLYVHGKDGQCWKRDAYGNHANHVNANANANGDVFFPPVPESVDWTAKGVVTPVKNQGNCGSCWSFSATGELECRYAIQKGVLMSLSEQELVDCAGSKYDSYGCNGGEENGGMQYAADNNGLCSEQEYSYKGTDGSCHASTCGTRYDANKGVHYITKHSSSALQTEVVNGCVSVAIDASWELEFYSSGVFDGLCTILIDHAVLVTGYGVDNTTRSAPAKYWKVKNSWGTNWGMEGYVNICRECDKNGRDGQCGILMWPSIADF
jgi:C1A family cysteine protease